VQLLVLLEHHWVLKHLSLVAAVAEETVLVVAHLLVVAVEQVE
jgi:hypothetical protein